MGLSANSEAKATGCQHDRSACRSAKTPGREDDRAPNADAEVIADGISSLARLAIGGLRPVMREIGLCRSSEPAMLM